jgi:hypothetical protein
VSGTLAGAFGGTLTGVGPDVGYIGVALASREELHSSYCQAFRNGWCCAEGWPGQRGGWQRTPAFLAESLLGFPIMIVVAKAMVWELPSAAAWGLEGLLQAWCTAL